MELKIELTVVKERRESICLQNAMEIYFETVLYYIAKLSILETVKLCCGLQWPIPLLLTQQE